ncbi:hypothetical protein TNCT_529951 [Trichonephila clavata]|uniref:Uncharacterized protein n=1 Tax=Trichonephila clavata TaxID=2740835 RepID=A0A8X6J9C0_TRICU|nr:hypothetical protein TNCT_529951 [Trichonephila clavata]
MNQQRKTWTPGNEEVVIRLVKDNPSTSSQALAQQVGLFQSIVWRILTATQMREPHLHYAQLLQPEDHQLHR